VPLERRRQRNPVPRRVGAELREVVLTPRAEDERLGPDPGDEVGEYLGEEGRGVHIGLGDAGERGAEVTQHRLGDRAHEAPEFVGDRPAGSCEPHCADLDGFHPVLPAALLPAGGFEIHDDVLYLRHVPSSITACLETGWSSL
jgi:hypothetical protein